LLLLYQYKAKAFLPVSKKNPKKLVSQFQVFSFTNKIRRLASHLELQKRFSSERGVRILLGKRGRLLALLANK
jgi:ribosomal protein S15P/S13E